LLPEIGQLRFGSKAVECWSGAKHVTKREQLRC
jgi:hypothetical protein